MAIDFNCPHCLHPYKLKDEFAGKRATCKNPDCRQVIVIPKPDAVPEDQRPSAADLEAAALSALNDDAARPQEQAPVEKVISMTCTVCEHKWTEPFSKAGKNTLCPNPDCRYRIKVPELKGDEQQDWRQTKTKLPSGAKQNFEKLEGVEDAAEAKIVSGAALREADATGIEIEPRTLKEKLVIGLTVFAIIAGVSLGIFYLVRARTNDNHDRLMADARKAFEDSRKELAPVDDALFSAVLNLSAAEYALRQNTTEKLKEAHNLFGKARDDLKDLPPTAEKNAVATEIALAAVALGGSDEQVKEQVRYRWLPDLSSGRLKMNERTHTVYEELRQSLGLLNQADFEFRVSVARRLTRELFKKGQAGFAADIIPLALFDDAFKDEATAVIALELYRLDKGSDIARRIAEELRAKKLAELNEAKAANRVRFPFWGDSYAPSAYTLFAVESMPLPGFGEPLPNGGELSNATRLAHVGIALLEGDADEAMKRALRPRVASQQLKSLLLCAEWMPNPAAALEEAKKLVEDEQKKARLDKQPMDLSQSHIFRLAQIAGSSGLADQAKAFAGALTDEGLNAWAIGDAIHLRLTANPKEKADANALERPEDEKKLKVGHIWGIYWIARRNAAESGDAGAEKKIAEGWPSPVKPFGLAGTALGLQDR
jgi:hypothetical protein